MIFALVAGFAVAPVLLSHDVYSYVDYARLGVVHDLNPYTHPPAAAPFDPAYARVTWTHTTSAYGPLFTLATYPLAWLPVWLAVAALKATAALSVLATALLVARVAPSRGVSPIAAAAFVALNPLVLIHVVGGAHNDGVAMLAATAGIAATLTARDAGAGAAFVAAFAIKAPAGLAAPFALLGTSVSRDSLGPKPGAGRDLPPSGSAIAARVRRLFSSAGGRFLLGTALAATAVALAAYAAFGWHWLEGLDILSSDRSSHMSVPITFARITNLDPTAVRAGALALLAAFTTYQLVRTWQGADWLRSAAWTSLALLLATAWLLPWYLIWTLPLAALSRDRPLQLLTLALTAFQLPARMPL